jgi:hypothetical protein
MIIAKGVWIYLESETRVGGFTGTTAARPG